MTDTLRGKIATTIWELRGADSDMIAGAIMDLLPVHIGTAESKPGIHGPRDQADPSNVTQRPMTAEEVARAKAEADTHALLEAKEQP